MIETNGIYSPQFSQTRAILARPINPSAYIVYVVIIILIPMLSEFILLLRVLAVYPPRRLSRRSIAAVYGPIAVLKTARLINNIIFAVRWVESATGDSRNVLEAGQASWSLPFTKIEWFLMLFDTS